MKNAIKKNGNWSAPLRWLTLGLLLSALTACGGGGGSGGSGGGGSGGTSSSTYKATLTAVQLQDSRNSRVFSSDNLPVEGSTVTRN